MEECKVSFCEDDASIKGFCARHYKQMYRHGKIFKRTVFDPNDIVVLPDVALLYLRTKQGDVRAFVLLDVQDVPRARRHKWCLEGDRVVCGTLKQSLASFLLNAPLVDHANHNKLDNRRQNLRECDKSQNTINSKVRRTSVSGFKGVCWDRERDKWLAQLTLYGIKKLYKRFSDKGEAIEAYKKAACKYHGDFVCYVGEGV